nr:MAK10-like protein [Tanacetum cinerariifolium]
MEAHLAPKQPVQVNKISSSCEICSGPHDTQYCMENPKQAFIDYASSHTDEVGASLKERNMNPSSPKHVHFINSIVILSENEAKEEGSVNPNATKYKDHKRVVEVKEEIEEETLECLLEEIHETWAHLEKKRTRIRLYTKSLEETIIQTMETTSPTLVTTSELDQDDVKTFKTALECSRLKRNPRSFIEATTSGIL